MSDSKSPIIMIDSRKAYDWVKYAALVVLPSLATLYFALSQIWGLPYGKEIVGSITAVDTFLGVVLHVSSNNYNNSEARFDGTMNVVETDTAKTFTLDLSKHPDVLEKQDQVVFKVERPS